jgi:riboflavin synthase
VFTGLITHVGAVEGVADTAAGRAFTIAVPWSDLIIGESIACQGVCLTVTAATPGEFTVAAVTTTLARTTLGDWRTGQRVNLERALRATDRLGGHLVQGHVDGVGEVEAVRHEGDARVIEVNLWEGAEALCVPQGSIALDGVSLTIHALRPPHGVAVAVIDHTRTHTTLGDRRPGDRVNVELDLVGKYIRQIAAPWGATGAAADSGL